MSDLEASLNGLDLFGGAVRRQASGILNRRFIVSPFTVLDTKSGDWQQRKRAWKSLGIQSELGRPKNTQTGGGGKWLGDTTSIFDPVVCELVYRWFSPENGQVLDPFAGGSVRGIVAGCLGRRYWGCDLSAEQVAANFAQGQAIECVAQPFWVCGDSLKALAEPATPNADLLFSCPPYGDLERYSDDPRDLSTMEWHTFTAAYKHVIFNACRRLKDERFAVFVVGNFRDKRGHLNNLMGETVAGFQNAGLYLYNDAVLLSPAGSAPFRVGGHFPNNRKLERLHQHLLVFVKGDWRRACAALAPAEME